MNERGTSAYIVANGNALNYKGGHDLPERESRTTGWRPGCDCGGEPVPCTVLDPFGGSGTTGSVASGLGRSAVLVELNLEYVKLAQGRCGLFCSVISPTCVNTASSEDMVEALVCARIAADKAQKALKTADREWAAAAKRLSGADWRKAVDKVKGRIVRIQAACIVWWDHFGPRPASDPWTDLDDYKAAWRADKNADKSKVQAALVKIGYPKHKAAERMKLADEDSANAEHHARHGAKRSDVA